MVERQTVIDAIEDSLFSFPDVPGQLWVLSVPGIEGRHTNIPTPELNLVGKTQLTDENVDTTIAQIREIFRREGKLVGWLVTPQSQPTDLADHLQQAGFALAEEAAGMVLRDMEKEIPTNPDVRVERLNVDDIGDMAPMMARAYGLPLEVAQPFADLCQGLARHMDFWVYVAYLPESDKPVAFAVTIFPPDSSLIVLQGAGTLPEHRGRGVYSTLVARRLRDARERGRQAAVIQANRETSAPIAEKLGFEEFVPLTIYAWDPATAS